MVNIGRDQFQPSEAEGRILYNLISKRMYYVIRSNYVFDLYEGIIFDYYDIFDLTNLKLIKKTFFSIKSMWIYVD